MVELIALISILFITFIAIEYYRYIKSGYQRLSGKSFVSTRLSRVDYEIYKIFSSLIGVKGFSKILFHVNVSEGKEKSTGVDVVFLNETGIYVMKVNDAVGRVSGKEGDKEWSLTTRNGRKQPFINPILENQHNINAIKDLIALEDNRIFKSYIIFGEGCTIKDVRSSSQNIRLIKRDKLFEVIKRDIEASDVVLSHKELYYIYLQLHPYTVVNNKADMPA